MSKPPPLEVAYTVLLEHGLDGAGKALHILVDEADKATSAFQRLLPLRLGKPIPPAGGFASFCQVRKAFGISGSVTSEHAQRSGTVLASSDAAATPGCMGPVPLALGLMLQEE